MGTVGNRKVTEDSPKNAGGHVAKDPKTTDGSTKKESGSTVKDPQAIKLPKRRPSVEKNISAEKPDVKPPRVKRPRMKSPAVPEGIDGNRIEALKQRLLAMQSAQQQKSRKISIPLSKSEGNVAKKTRSFEDKVKLGF